jgi:outer membrane biosynthesis protein TonB
MKMETAKHHKKLSKILLTVIFTVVICCITSVAFANTRETQVYIEIDETGKVYYAYIHRSSGNRQWDLEALKIAMDMKLPIMEGIKPVKEWRIIKIKNNNKITNKPPLSKPKPKPQPQPRPRPQQKETKFPSIILIGMLLAIGYIIYKTITNVRAEIGELKKEDYWNASKNKEKIKQKNSQGNTNTLLKQKNSHENTNALFIEFLRDPKNRKYIPYQDNQDKRNYQEEEQNYRNDQNYAPKNPMTKTEMILYFRLIEAIGNQCLILAQIQMASFLKIRSRNQSEYYKRLNPILMKSVDFLIIEKSGKTIAAIELQDWTHNREDRKISDKFKRETLKNAGIPLIEFHAEYLPSVEKIKQSIPLPA